MHSARERVEHERWLAEIARAGDELGHSPEATSCAEDLFLSEVPDSDRSKRVAVAASVYAGGLITGDGRSQGEVAEAVGVSRLSIQHHWKAVVERAGLEAPGW